MGRRTAASPSAGAIESASGSSPPALGGTAPAANDCTAGLLPRPSESRLIMDTRSLAPKGIKVIANAGGVNPQACLEAVLALAKQQGIKGLKEGIAQGKAGHADAAAQAIENAIPHLSEAM